MPSKVKRTLRKKQKNQTTKNAAGQEWEEKRREKSSLMGKECQKGGSSKRGEETSRGGGSFQKSKAMKKFERSPKKVCTSERGAKSEWAKSFLQKRPKGGKTREPDERGRFG